MPPPFRFGPRRATGSRYGQGGKGLRFDQGEQGLALRARRQALALRPRHASDKPARDRASTKVSKELRFGQADKGHVGQGRTLGPRRNGQGGKGSSLDRGHRAIRQGLALRPRRESGKPARGTSDKGGQWQGVPGKDGQGIALRPRRASARSSTEAGIRQASKGSRFDQGEQRIALRASRQGTRRTRALWPFGPAPQRARRQGLAL
ncbi:hypothetical protein PRIPAC_87316 [Pristionchus pacificus]|uniref:Uncharacterized protein n=1 Tax=Pristionchus pacificus TaxID=54126 RepID=A0A2A6BZ53_PRIPA|nr:hypothetical protein PRIPAC_87316 [Pristionchus pacificus]|eukprot:PDM71195.1 hypothetical protein PRIPAC_43578 [Pristionchus pacificus]